MTIAADADDWIETWLSQPRFAAYLKAAGDDRGRAVALYEWNAGVAAAFHHDLAHVEVGLRNAYDQALCRATPACRPHWVFGPECFFPPQRHKAANGRSYDANEKSRRLIAEALKNATPKPAAGDRARGILVPPSPGKAIAELGFGFWRYLSAKRQHDPLWVPCLHTAFRPRTDRRDVDRPVGRLHNLRNRVAHHELLLAIDLESRHRDVVTLAGLISPELAVYITANSSWPRLAVARP